MKKIIIITSAIITFLGIWFFTVKPIPPFGAISPIVLTDVQLAEQCIAIKKMEACLGNLTAQDKAMIKSKEISKFNHVGTYESLGLTIEIQSLKNIKIENSYGIEILARAWKGNKQLGFGEDGSIEIERFRIFNPPILVDDPNGTVIREWIVEKTNELKQRKLREDPIKAIQETLASIIRVTNKENTKIVKGKIGNTVSTFYPDPNVETTSVDGRALRDVTASYASIHDGAGTASDDLATNSAGVTIDSIVTSNQFNGLIRGFLLFDSSSIPDGDSVSAAIITLQVTSTSNQMGGDSVRLVTTTPASNTAIVDADYTQLGTAAQATDVAISGITAPAATDWTLNAVGRGNVSKTSISKFGIRLVTDADNTSPTWAANASINIFIDWADKAGTTTDPKMVVTHAVAAATVNRNQIIE